MAISINWPTGRITINQGDCTLVTGTLYELDTNWFRKQLKLLEMSDAGIPWPVTHDHNTSYTVFGETYARKVEILSPYSCIFLPDTLWSCRLVGSNNNIADVEAGILVQNSVQVIPGNTAGLIETEIDTGGGGSCDQVKNLIISGAF